MSANKTPQEKFKDETVALFNRWFEESDLDELEMASIVLEVCNEQTGSMLEFDSDIDLEEDE